MKNKNIVIELVMVFFTCTSLITIGTGIIGTIYLKEASLSYSAFFGPPVIGFISSLLGFINYSKKELTVARIILRRGIHLLLIEGMIFGLNYLSGVTFTLKFAIIIAVLIMLIFVLVHVIIWINDKRMSDIFNKELENFQKKIAENK